VLGVPFAVLAPGGQSGNFLIHPPKCHYRVNKSPPVAKPCVRNKLHCYSERLLAPRQTPKQEDHPLLAVRDCLFNIFPE